MHKELHRGERPMPWAAVFTPGDEVLTRNLEGTPERQITQLEPLRSLQAV